MKEGKVTTRIQVGSVQNEGLDKKLESLRLESGDVRPEFEDKLVLAKNQLGLREGRVLAVKGQTIFHYKSGKRAEPFVFDANESGTTVVAESGERIALDEVLVPKISVRQNILA